MTQQERHLDPGWKKKIFWYQKAGVSNASDGCGENQRSIITHTGVLGKKKVLRHSSHSKWRVRFSSRWRDSLQDGWHQGWEVNWTSVSNYDLGSLEVCVYPHTEKAGVSCAHVWRVSEGKKSRQKLKQAALSRADTVQFLSHFELIFHPCDYFFLICPNFLA